MASAEDVDRVVLASDDPAFRTTLAVAFRAAGYVVDEAATGTAALKFAGRGASPVIVTDFHLADMWGYELCDRLSDRTPSAPTVLLCDENLGASARVAGFLIGADECIDKPIDLSELLARVRRLGGSGSDASRRDHTDLTPRELDVLRRLAHGRRPAEIAAALFISRRTVDTHIQHILRKLGVNTRAQAVALAFQTKLVRPGEEPASRDPVDQ